MTTHNLKGYLEIDTERGVIYFHADANYGATMLRICCLPKPIPYGIMLDITHMKGASWETRSGYTTIK